MRVLPILKVYLLKLALKKKKEMLQKILELEARGFLALEVCYFFFLVLTILSVVEVPLFPQ